MDILRLWRRMRKSLLFVMAIAIIAAAGAAFAAHKWMKPTYQATATLMVVPSSHSSDFLTALVTDQQLVDTYASLSTTSNLLTSTLNDLNLNWSWSTLAKDVSSTPISNTNLLSIKVSATNPQLTAQLANTLAHNTSVEVQNLVGKPQLEIVDPATIPSTPSSSPTLKYGVAAAMACLILGVGLLLLREYFDDSIRDPHEAEKDLGLCVVGTIPWVAHLPSHPGP